MKPCTPSVLRKEQLDVMGMKGSMTALKIEIDEIRLGTGDDLKSATVSTSFLYTCTEHERNDGHHTIEDTSTSGKPCNTKALSRKPRWPPIHCATGCRRNPN